MATTKSALGDDAVKAPKSTDRQVECRVIAANFAGTRKGAVVKVPESYLRKVPKGVLITLEEEKRHAEGKEQSSEAAHSTVGEKARREAWAALEDQRVNIHREKNLAEALRVVESAGLKPPEDLK